jgi:DNA polymerase V
MVQIEPINVKKQIVKRFPVRSLSASCIENNFEYHGRKRSILIRKKGGVTPMDLTIQGYAASCIGASAASPEIRQTSPAGFSVREDHMEVGPNLQTYLVKHPAATYYMRVNGDALAPWGIRHQDLLVVDRAVKPIAGKLVVAVLEGKFLLTNVYVRDNQLFLVPAGKQHKPIPVDGERDMTVWGVVQQVIHSL